MSSSSSSSSEEASADAREVESVHLPAKNPPVVAPAPVRQESDGDEGDDDDEDAEDSGSEAREEGEEDSDTEEDGHSSDEDYEDEVVEDSEPDEPLPPPPLTKSRGKSPPSPDLTKQPVAKRNAAAAGLAESSSSKKRAPPVARTKSLPLKPAEKKLPPPEEEAAKEEVAKSTAPKAAARRKRRNKSPTNAPAKDSTKWPPSKNNKAAPAAMECGKEVAKSPNPKNKSPNKVGVAKSPPAPAAAADAPSGAAEAGQMEKSARYWHLMKEVGLLEVANYNPGVLDAAFLEMDDDKAAMLNTRIIKQKLAECKVKNEWWDIKKEVTEALLDTMNK